MTDEQLKYQFEAHEYSLRALRRDRNEKGFYAAAGVLLSAAMLTLALADLPEGERFQQRLDERVLELAMDQARKSPGTSGTVESTRTTTIKAGKITTTYNLSADTLDVGSLKTQAAQELRSEKNSGFAIMSGVFMLLSLPVGATALSKHKEVKTATKYLADLKAKANPPSIG